jgi:hypothetical protein
MADKKLDPPDLEAIAGRTLDLAWVVNRPVNADARGSAVPCMGLQARA